MIRWTDADDRHRHTINRNNTPDDGTIRTEHPGPRLIPEDADQRSPGSLFRLVEPATERRPESQDVEIRRRREFDGRVPDRAVEEIARWVRKAGGHRPRKDVGVFSHVLVGGIRRDDHRSTRTVVLVDVDQTIGLGERLVAEQHRVDETEDRGVGADGDAEDQYCRRGEAPVAHEATERLPRVAHERVPGGRPARVAAGFLELLDAAEQPQRLEARLFSGQAAHLQTIGLSFEMELQFFAQIRFTAVAEHDRSQPASQDVQEAHVMSFAARG